MEVLMFDQIELAQRLIIIKHAGLDDVTILDENYRHLMRDSEVPEEKQQLKILQDTVKNRIVELTGKNGTRLKSNS
jgi:hypothetical protein